MTCRRFSAPTAACVAAGLTGAAACGQEQYLFIQTSGLVTPEQPVVQVDVWAAFDRAYYAFSGAWFDVVAQTDNGAFTDPLLPKGFYGDRGNVSPDGDAVFHVQSGQYQYPPNLLADTSDPILIWSCSWTTTDFRPRRVELSMDIYQFWVYFDWFGQNGGVPYVPEAFGTIEVVPAPGAGLVFAVGAAWMHRRRG